MQDNSPFIPPLLLPTFENQLTSESQSQLELSAYEKIKMIAIYQLGYKIFTALSLPWHATRKCRSIYGKHEIPYGMFQWDLEQFIERRKYNPVWMKLLAIQIPKAYMNIRKLEIDIEELIRFMRIMFDDYSQNRSTTAIDELICSADNLINYEDILRDEMERHSQLSSYGRNLSMAMSFIRYGRCNARKSAKLNNFNRQIQLVCENRYQSEYQRVLEEQTKMYHDCQEDKLQSAIDQMNIRIEREMTASRGAMDMYFTTIQSYREHIEKMRHKYELEYSKWDGQLSFKTTSINKYRARMKFLKAQLEWYKEEANSPVIEAPQGPTLYNPSHSRYTFDTQNKSLLDESSGLGSQLSNISAHHVQPAPHSTGKLKRTTSASLNVMKRGPSSGERFSRAISRQKSAATQITSSLKRKSKELFSKFHFLRRESGISLMAQPYRRSTEMTQDTQSQLSEGRSSTASKNLRIARNAKNKSTRVKNTPTVKPSFKSSKKDEKIQKSKN